MKWSFRLGRFWGIDLSVHVTFLLLLVWIGGEHWLAARNVGAAFAGVAFVVAIFGCVVLHEYGHALTARRFGIPTRDIILLPIGGVARLERMPEKPVQELLVAIAGPAVNVVIAALGFGWLLATDNLVPLQELSLSKGPVVERLMWANVVLVVFNLVPAFPMDGGRVLRALLAMRLDYVHATQVAATVGQGFALLLGFMGLFGNPMLVLIALFVWIGAGQEAGMVQARAALGGIPLRHVMVTDFQTLDAEDQLSRAVELTLRTSQKEFPVLRDGFVAGILTQPALLKALEADGRVGRVADAMAVSFETAELHELAETVFRRLQSCECRTVPVLAAGRLVGLVTMENIGEFLSFDQAIRRR